MEQYEKQSHTPERLDIGCHGRPGLNGEPWSLVADDMMKQNILIIAYDKPVTTVEIARALGIPTPYIEKAVGDLVKSELMSKTGNKVFTDFMITLPEDLLKNLDREILRRLLPDCRIKLPKHLESRVAEFRQYSLYAVPMAIIKKAIANGDFLKNTEQPAPPMVLAVEEADGV